MGLSAYVPGCMGIVGCQAIRWVQVTHKTSTSANIDGLLMKLRKILPVVDKFDIWRNSICRGTFRIYLRRWLFNSPDTLLSIGILQMITSPVMAPPLPRLHQTGSMRLVVARSEVSWENLYWDFIQYFHIPFFFFQTESGTRALTGKFTPPWPCIGWLANDNLIISLSQYQITDEIRSGTPKVIHLGCHCQTTPASLQSTHIINDHCW